MKVVTFHGKQHCVWDFPSASPLHSTYLRWDPDLHSEETQQDSRVALGTDSLMRGQKRRSKGSWCNGLALLTPLCVPRQRLSPSSDIWNPRDVCHMLAMAKICHPVFTRSLISGRFGGPARCGEVCCWLPVIKGSPTKPAGLQQGQTVLFSVFLINFKY